MRLQLASTLRNRTHQTTKDARLLNALAEQKGDMTRVVKRPALVQTFDAINVGAGRGLYNWTTPTTEEVVAITGDVLSYGLTSVVRRLKFTTQPVNWKLDTAMSPSVVVAVQDSFGNTKTSYTGTVTIALSANPSGGTLSGTLSVAAVAGVATFSNLKLNKVGGGYSLKATATDLKQKVSSVFKIISNLSFTIQPAGELSDTVMETVEVSVQDSAGATVTGYTGNITLAIGYNGGIAHAGTLSGTLTRAAVNGVASFTNLSIDEAGEYALSASASGGLVNVTSSFFDIGLYTLTIKTQATNYNVRTAFLAKYTSFPSVAYTLRVTVNSGIVVLSTSTSTPAMTWDPSWTGTPTFTLINNGYIVAKGGNAGIGSNTGNGSDGTAAGNALELSGRTVSITNVSGSIWGGGGGGGGGAYAHMSTVDLNEHAYGSGGGGGGGAGEGIFGSTDGNVVVGASFSIVTASASGVTPSSRLAGAGAGGTGGLITGVGLTITGGAGGSGGDYAVAGSSGANGTTAGAPFGSAEAGVGGVGGAAGKAINLSGGTANFVSGGSNPNVKGAVS